MTTDNNENKIMSTTVSAPGKILLAGGYVVLEAPNVGVVLAVDKRFYSTVAYSEESNTEPPEAKKAKTGESSTSSEITVHSPQFGATWTFHAVKQQQHHHNSELELTPDPNNASANTFVEKTLRITLAYLLCSSNNHKPLPSCLEITILADNDFYSVTPHLQARNWEATPENLAKLPKFLPCQTSKGSLQKTGLGSSAALVTSLVGALVLSLSSNQKTLDDTTKRYIHNLAQICHCHAQGKVGSGFDVSSASYGSHVYQRFPKSLLSGLLQDLEESNTSSMISQELAETLQKLVEQKWTGGVQKPLFWNPDLLQIMLADVSGGSESPSMARKILSWKALSSDISCWNNLLRCNQQIVDLTHQIAAACPSSSSIVPKVATQLSDIKLEEGEQALQQIQDADINKVAQLLVQLRQALMETRKNLKTMGELADVPVEPDEQTALATATMDLPGVVASSVPGAGGYDALVVVYINTNQVRDRICDLWAHYKALQVCPLAVKFGDYGDGVRYESETPIPAVAASTT